MGKKIYHLFEYAYLIMAAFSIYLVFINWETDPTRSYLFLFFAVVAVFMFFFKRWFRKSVEKREQNQ